MTQARVTQLAVQAVHDALPSDTGTARVTLAAVQVVRSVAEVGSGSGGARRSVVVISA